MYSQSTMLIQQINITSNGKRLFPNNCEESRLLSFKQIIKNRIPPLYLHCTLFKELIVLQNNYDKHANRTKLIKILCI